VNYIKKAIESVLIQEGDFIHEIIISDDGSKDGTRAIIDEYTKQNHMRIRNISSDKNSGISTNFRKCFEAATGDYVAVLEGDDYWTDARKLEKQLEFMKSNKDCSMAFSKIEVHNVRNGTRKTLERQDNIKKTRLTGEDFLNDSSMNLIANFSSCMFRADLMKQAPALLFEKRISEIAVVLYLEQHGPIGFLDEVMSVYLQHPNGVWSGSDRLGQLKSGLETRRIAKEIAHPRHRDKIQKIIDEQFVAKLGVMS
jgi:glycosyltransferase involved in cell wall biosynthesis